MLDGRNRLDALELLGREVLDDKGKLNSKYHRQTPTNLGNMPDLVAWVISTNIRRRHLNAAQKRELLATLLKTDPKKSNLQVSKTTGISDKTVAKVRKNLEGRSEIPNVTTATDTAGRVQPTHKSPAKPRAIKVEAAPTPHPSNVTKLHDLDARRLLSEIDALDPAEMSTPNSFGEALQVRASRFLAFTAVRKEAK